MIKWNLLSVLEVCITQNWEDLYPCEVFLELDFPRGNCDGNCGRCLLDKIQKEEKEND